MNIDKIKQVIEHLKQVDPSTFNMTSWYDDAKCIGGHTLLALDGFVLPKEDEEDFGPARVNRLEERFQSHFDIDPSLCHQITYPETTDAMCKMGVRCYDATPEYAVRLLENFITTNEVNWNFAFGIEK